MITYSHLFQRTYSFLLCTPTYLQLLQLTRFTSQPCLQKYPDLIVTFAGPPEAKHCANAKGVGSADETDEGARGFDFQLAVKTKLKKDSCNPTSTVPFSLSMNVLVPVFGIRRLGPYHQAWEDIHHEAAAAGALFRELARRC